MLSWDSSCTQRSLFHFLPNKFPSWVLILTQWRCCSWWKTPKQHTQSICQVALKKVQLTICYLAKIISMLISLLPACPLGRAHYRSMEIIKIEALSLRRWDWDAMCSLYGQAITDLQWSVVHLLHTCCPIARNCHNMTIFSDMSDFQWGAVYNGHLAQGMFSPEQATWHINKKETLAIYYTIRSFHPYFLGDHLLVSSNNTMVMATVHDMGTLLCPIWDHLMRQIWQIMYEQDCWLSLNWITSSENTKADATSCRFNPRTEWMLPCPLFHDIANHFGCPSINLFAFNLSKQLN